MQKNARAKGLKRKARIGAKLVVRRAPGSVPDTISFLNSIANNPGRKPLVKKAAYNLARILREAPDVGVKAMDRLLLIEAHKGLSFVTVCRIFGSPLAFTTIKGKMKALAHHEIEFEGLLRTFEELQKDVKLAYERKIPEGVAGHVVECKRGEFYRKLIYFGAHHRASKSYLTDMVVSRMEYLGLPESEIKEVEAIKGGMHQQFHKERHLKKRAKYEATEGKLEAAENSRKAANTARKKMRRLEKVLYEKFVKKL